MWKSQVYGHHDKMARTKTHRTSQNTEYTKTQQTLRNNYFCVFFGFLISMHPMLCTSRDAFNAMKNVSPVRRCLANMQSGNGHCSAYYYQHFIRLFGDCANYSNINPCSLRCRISTPLSISDQLSDSKYSPRDNG